MSKSDKGRLPPFVPLLKETMQSDAWKAMSHGARSLYVALKARYSQNVHNNGRIYLPQRIAAEEIGSHTNQITRWFRELQHYGLIVMTDPGCLGVDGKGRAPRWRLTELGFMKDPPTRDFLRWDGKRFVAPEKQNPVRESTDKVSVKARTGMSVKARTSRSQSVRESTYKGKDHGVRESTYKSIIPLPTPEGGTSASNVVRLRSELELVA
jgi:hypothetical protein